jgi:hypothetical protein
VAESNWPLKASFVVFLRNIVELARAHRAGGVLGPAGTGDALRVRVPLDVERVEAELPNGSRLELPAHDGLCVLPQLTQAGFYYLSYEGRRPGSLLVAASLFSETEGKLSPRERRFADAEQALGSTSPLEALREWGFVLAFAALVFVALDLWLLERKPRSVLPPTVARPRLPDRPRPLSSQP